MMRRRRNGRGGRSPISGGEATARFGIGEDGAHGVGGGAVGAVVFNLAAGRAPLHPPAGLRP
jgi:hypothetical protein